MGNYSNNKILLEQTDPEKISSLDRLEYNIKMYEVKVKNQRIRKMSWEGDMVDGISDACLSQSVDKRTVSLIVLLTFSRQHQVSIIANVSFKEFLTSM